MIAQRQQRLRSSRFLVRMAAVVTLCIALGTTLAVYAARPTRQGWGLLAEATLSPAPNPATIVVGSTGSVVWNITELDGLFAFELKIGFDPTVVQVVDADPTLPGIQAQLGSIPSSVDWYVVLNEVDNIAGTVWVAASMVQDYTPGVGAGSLIEIEFQAIDEGSSPLDFATLYVSDQLCTARDVQGIDGVINAVPGSATPTATATPTSTPFDVPTPTVTPTIQPGIARIVLAPAYQEVPQGLTTSVDIRIEDVVDLFGVEMEISFDPLLIQGEDGDDGWSGIQVEIGDFPSPDYVPVNVINNVTGTISFAVAQLEPRLPISGSGRVGRIIFRGTQLGIAPVQITTATLSDGEGSVLPATFSDAEVHVISQGALVGQLSYDGRGLPPNMSWVNPISVTLSAPGDFVPTYTFAALTDPYGVFTTTNVVTGTYDVRVRDLHSLWNVYRDLAIDATGVSADFGTLVDGDATLSGAIDILDFAVLANVFGTAVGDPGWDPRADFNNSMAIDILDFSLLATSYERSGEVDVTP